MQATVSQFDPETRAGKVVLDDGVELSFDRAAFDVGGLRTVRFGQRVRLEMDAPKTDDGDDAHSIDNRRDDLAQPGIPRIRAVWLATMRPLA